MKGRETFQALNGMLLLALTRMRSIACLAGQISTTQPCMHL